MVDWKDFYLSVSTVLGSVAKWRNTLVGILLASNSVELDLYQMRPPANFHSYLNMDNYKGKQRGTISALHLLQLNIYERELGVNDAL